MRRLLFCSLLLIMLEEVHQFQQRMYQMPITISSEYIPVKIHMDLPDIKSIIER